MTPPLTDAELLARRFHEAYERLAPQFGYETRAETRAFDPSTANGKLMVAVCAELFTTATAGAMTLQGIDELYERSKDDRAIIVGSEVGQLCATARAFHAAEQRVREEAAVAVWIDAMDYCRKLGISPSHKNELFRACKVIRALNASTAPQLSTAADRLAPSPEGAGQGEAAEAVGLPKLCPACRADTAFVSAFARTLVYRKTLLTIPDMEQTTCYSCAYTYQTHGQHDRNISKIKAAFLTKQGGK